MKFLSDRVRSPWRKAALGFCAGSLASFIANLSFTIWAVSRSGSNIQNGVGVISEGSSCSRAKNINTGIHVFINVLSSILLAGSNYCMQFLSAPTRDQIDKAHQKTQWVDIGVSSTRNLFIIPWGNALIWALLSLSSLPLHLFYNSAIFASISTNEYNVTVVNEAFMTQDNRTELPPYLQTSDLDAMYRAAVEDRVQRLDPSTCLNAYASNFQSDRGDLLLVTPGFTMPLMEQNNLGLRTEALYRATTQPYWWMCTQDWRVTEFSLSTNCEDMIPQFKAHPDSWTPFNVTVKECYSLQTSERCRLLFIPTLCWLVTVLNLFKALLMLSAALRPDTKPLLTLGDAVASFVAVPDKCTDNMCLVSKQDIVGSLRSWPRTPRLLTKHKRQRKFAAVSTARFYTCILLDMLALLLCAGLFVYGWFWITGERNLPTLMALGLGTPSSKTIIQASNPNWGWYGLLYNVILANSPQAVLSVLYFIYNGLFTTISLAIEWDSYARNRKGLRVSSNPVGAQRASYYLQLPYRYSLPLLAFSVILHWLISQSIFLVFIDISSNPIGAGPESNYNPGSYNACGWSPVGVICVMVVGVVMVAVLLLCGCRRLISSSVMPVVGSCSAAISAACHPVLHDERACLEPLQWGESNYYEGNENRHCSFSSGEVNTPQEGIMYY
ncbi:hypothetical protein C8A03DRAFT_47693 [Achaetomium macrosporum]|uniref:DUF6536 domain-containing protein n=1 Tax=Achaetomium macrosporum TaxID=79813 RepID=A0AAN7C1Y0_9PEZI|nr:hypothetical protein C8A03DRAFT_47693 [Achaetomium macrosporum]